MAAESRSVSQMHILKTVAPHFLVLEQFRFASLREHHYGLNPVLRMDRFALEKNTGRTTERIARCPENEVAFGQQSFVSRAVKCNGHD